MPVPRLSVPCLLALVALAAGRPNDVRTSVVATQTGWTRGGASQVSQARGQAAANSIGVTQGPGFNQRDERAANAAVALQGASAGNGDFNQLGSVVTETEGRLGRVGTRGASFNQGRVNNAAATGVLTGGAAANQQVSQAGFLLGGGQRVGQRGTNLNLATAGNINTQTGATGTGAFGGTNTVQTAAEHVGPLDGGLGGGGFGGPGGFGGGGPGVTFQTGGGVPGLGNLRTTPPPPPMPMRMMMMMRGRGRD